MYAIMDPLEAQGLYWPAEVRHKRSAAYLYWSDQPVKRHGDASVSTRISQ